MRAFLSPWGRRPRLTYWRAAALVPLMALLAAVIVVVVATRLSPSQAAFVITYVTIAIQLVALWAGLAIAIQRLHDRDMSGWWVLLALVPVGGTVWYLFWNGLRPGTLGPNRFGPDPLTRYAGAAAVFDDGPVPKATRRPVVSTIVAWGVLLASLAFVLLFQNPDRAPHRNRMPTAPVER